MHLMKRAIVMRSLVFDAFHNTMPGLVTISVAIAGPGGNRFRTLSQTFAA